MTKPRLLIFASGSADGGGSGFEKLAEASRNGALNAEIVGVVSNHENGGVRKRADKFGVPFFHYPKPWTGEGYQELAQISQADFFALSGWLKMIRGLDPNTRFNSRTVFNIHPGPLPNFGGKGFYGHHIHEAVMEAFKRGEIAHSEINMHFVTKEYDDGPIFFRLKIKIDDNDTADSLGERVNQLEHKYQSVITNLVVNGHIKWDGIDPDSLEIPVDYSIEQES